MLTDERKELVKTNSSVQEAILAMEMKMNKLFHVQILGVMKRIARQPASWKINFISTPLK
jgi:hypothetical protein